MNKKNNHYDDVEPKSELGRIFLENLHHVVGRSLKRSSNQDKYESLATAIRYEMVDKWLETERRYREDNVKRVYYLSLEFLMGRTMRNALSNLGIQNEAEEALAEMGVKLEDIFEEEHHAGLGNGGLGRLAACFLDSMATLGIPGYGFGIRYQYGMFTQDVIDGWQVEKPDNWLFNGCPWEIRRDHRTVRVKFYGHTQAHRDADGHYSVEWADTQDVLAVPYAMFVPGYGNETVNVLTMWSAKATEEFNLDFFNQGDYIEAVSEKDQVESISKVLYPNDKSSCGRELRLKQQYFFVAASLHEIVNYYLEGNDSFDAFPDKVAIQLNDTHPAIAVAELTRILVDEHNLDWDYAWDIITRTLAYTNHTLLPEALETWAVDMFGKLLPRHLEIIYEINFRFLNQVNIFFSGDQHKLQEMSIIGGDGANKHIRMAHLAIVGSHSINGVAALHTELLKSRLFYNFNQMWPEKFNNKTNGITQRRWLKQANPDLSTLITDAIGEGWTTDLFELKKLEKEVNDKSFIKAWRDIKKNNKVEFARFCGSEFGYKLNPEAMFDVQVKRIHEYKRQLLNVLGVYRPLKNGNRQSHRWPGRFDQQNGFSVNREWPYSLRGASGISENPGGENRVTSDKRLVLTYSIHAGLIAR